MESIDCMYNKHGDSRESLPSCKETNMSWEFCLIVGIQYPEWDLRPRNKQDMKLFIKLFVQGSLVTKKNISKAMAQASGPDLPKSEA